MPLPAARQQQPACAACKHQRRRCTAECPLARYFPHDRPDLFRSAHRLFGVSNILKTLHSAGPDRARRDDAMHGLAYEAAAWDANPAGGCLPVIATLQSQLRQEHGILRCLHAQIRHYRSRPQSTPPLSVPPPTADVPPAPTESSNTHYFDEHNYVPASSGSYGNDNGDDGVVAAPSLPWTMQPQYCEGAIANMGGTVAQEENQYQLLFDHTATAGGRQHVYDEISPFLELEDINGDDHHDRRPPYESNSANSWKKMEIKPSTKMELGKVQVE